MITAHDYYRDFMGVDESNFIEGKRIFKCSNRDVPLNEKYYYPIIKSIWLEEEILSVSPRYYEEIISLQHNESKYSDNILREFLKSHLGFRIRKMHRYAYEKLNKQHTESRTMTIEDSSRLSLKGDFDINKYMERKKTIIEEKRQFITIDNEKVSAIGFISEITCGGGNVVVFTLEDFRNKGYAKEVIKGCINWCIGNEVLPIYLVEDTNVYSKRIPEALGFKKISEEWIISR